MAGCPLGEGETGGEKSASPQGAGPGRLGGAGSFSKSISAVYHQICVA